VPNAIELGRVTKTFGPKVAVRDFDLAVPLGALYGLIGPNGAGKTTTIRMIMSILFADSGSVSVLGHGSALEAKDRIGYLPEERGLYKKMRVGPFLAYMMRLKGKNPKDLRSRIRAALERIDLPGVETKRCEELSKGMQQKVQFLAAVMHDPDLLILDEPFSGLDPVNMRLLRELVVERHRNGATILFSTHVMAQAEQMCERVVMIHDGNKVLDASLAEIRRNHDPRAISFEPLDPMADISRLRDVRGVTGVTRDGAGYEIALAAGADAPAVLRELVSALPPARVELRRPTLEDVFVRIVKPGAVAASPEA
jgi:ABC-2 type transport system ATP-binding protein